MRLSHPMAPPSPPLTGYVTAGALVAASFQLIRKRAEVYVNRFVERALPGHGLPSDTHRVAPAEEERSGYPGLAAMDDPPGRSP